MVEALVNSKILRWARERAELKVDILAKKIGSAPAKVVEWEAGASRPTFRQAEKFAQVTHVPFGYLFLSEPPDEPLSIPDFRTVAGSPPSRLGADFKDTLRDVQFKLDWYRQYRIEQGHGKLDFVGRFDASSDPVEVAEDMRRTLALQWSERMEAHSWEEYFRLLVAKAEAAGIWVMRSGIVGSNTHRPLSVDVFRGFAISDNFVPLIFVNGRDARAAQVFTLAHELAHIWLGESGISDPFDLPLSSDEPVGRIEELCNSIAAEFLVPKEEFESSWNKGADIESNARALSVQFRVSRIVIAIRALEIGLVKRTDFNTFLEAERRKWSREREDTEGGGDYYRSAKARNGERFLKAVLASAMSGTLLLRNAGALLNMTPKNLLEAYRRQRAGQL